MTERCDLTELPVDGCSHCTGRDGGESERKARDKSLIDRRRAIPARYPGVCGGCGEHFPVGTPISSRGDGEFRASCCLDDQGAPTR